jgi:hypothetical protein
MYVYIYRYKYVCICIYIYMYMYIHIYIPSSKVSARDVSINKHEYILSINHIMGCPAECPTGSRDRVCGGKGMFIYKSICIYMD